MLLARPPQDGDTPDATLAKSKALTAAAAESDADQMLQLFGKPPWLVMSPLRIAVLMKDKHLAKSLWNKLGAHPSCKDAPEAAGELAESAYQCTFRSCAEPVCSRWQCVCPHKVRGQWCCRE